MISAAAGPVVRARFSRDGQRVGDEGEPAVQGQLGGQARDGRSGVEDDAAVGGQFGERGPRDAVLLVGGGGLALGEVGLEVEPPGREGPAVHAAHQTGPVEGLQIAPYGLGGDLEGGAGAGLPGPGRGGGANRGVARIGDRGECPRPHARDAGASQRAK